MIARGINQSNLPLLTEMRGVAALLVFHMHLAFYLPAFHIFQWAYLSVDFFFILSGFVLTHVYHAWFYPQFRPHSLRNFFWARFGRVYPLHFFYCAIYLILYARIFGHWQIKGFLHEVFLMNSLRRWPGQDPVSWSISCECVAYFFAPFLIRWLSAGKPWRIGFAFLGAAAWLCWQVLYCVWPLGLDIYSVTARCLPEFIMGICCYQICSQWPLRPRAAAVLFGLSFFTCVVAVVTIPSHGPRDLLCAFSFCGLIPSAIFLRGIFVRIFHGAFGYIGEISYSIYLVHPVLMLAVTPALIQLAHREGLSPFATTATTYLAMLLLLLGCSALSHRFIELPTRAFFKRFMHRPDNTPRPGVLAPVIEKNPAT